MAFYWGVRGKLLRSTGPAPRGVEFYHFRSFVFTEFLRAGEGERNSAETMTKVNTKKASVYLVCQPQELTTRGWTLSVFLY